MLGTWRCELVRNSSSAYLSIRINASLLSVGLKQNLRIRLFLWNMNSDDSAMYCQIGSSRRQKRFGCASISISSMAERSTEENPEKAETLVTLLFLDGRARNIFFGLGSRSGFSMAAEKFSCYSGSFTREFTVR